MTNEQRYASEIVNKFRSVSINFLVVPIHFFSSDNFMQYIKYLNELKFSSSFVLQLSVALPELLMDRLDTHSV